MNLSNEEILKIINNDELIRKYESKSTSYTYIFARQHINKKVSKYLCVKEASVYYDEQINTYNVNYDDPYEDIILDEIIKQENFIKLDPKISIMIFEWSLVNRKRFTIIHGLEGIHTTKKYDAKYSFIIEFVPPDDVIQLLRQLNMMDDIMVASIISACMIEDNFATIDWLFTNYDVLNMNFDEEIYMNDYVKDCVSSYIDHIELNTINLGYEHEVSYARFTPILWNTIHDHCGFECCGNDDYRRLKPINVNIYEATIKRMQKYTPLLRSADLYCYVRTLFYVMFILGDTTYCESNVLKYLYTLNPDCLSHDTFIRNCYTSLFNKLSHCECYILMRSHVETDHLIPHENIFDMLVKSGDLEKVIPGFKLSSLRCKYSIDNLNSALKYEIGTDNYDKLSRFLPVAVFGTVERGLKPVLIRAEKNGALSGKFSHLFDCRFKMIVGVKNTFNIMLVGDLS